MLGRWRITTSSRDADFVVPVIRFRSCDLRILVDPSSSRSRRRTRPAQPAAANLRRSASGQAAHAGRCPPIAPPGVCPWCPCRHAQHTDPLSSEDRVERGGGLGVPIPDQEPELADAVLEDHEQVAGLLCHPLPDRMCCHPEQRNPAAGDLDHKQHIQPLEQHRVHGEEVHRQCPGGLGS
jgi:hypothetical protein